MPAELPHRREGRVGHVENALAVGASILVLVRVVDDLGEEARGRQLLGVADHHDLLGAHDRSERVFGRHLRGLIDHDEIEREVAPEILRHRERRHHPAGLEVEKRPARPGGELAHGGAVAALADLVPDHAHLGERADLARAVALRRIAPLGEQLADGGPGKPCELAVDAGDLTAQTVEIGAVPGIHDAAVHGLDMIRQAAREDRLDDSGKRLAEALPFRALDPAGQEAQTPVLEGRE